MRNIFFVVLVLLFSSALSFADDQDYSLNNDGSKWVPSPTEEIVGQGSLNRNMEQCHVVDANGRGLIKPYMAESGTNQEGDPNAWIWVPIGYCERLNIRDFNGIDQSILDKIY